MVGAMKKSLSNVQMKEHKTMNEITKEAINEAIDNCEWRMDVCGAFVCTENCGVCRVEIEQGRCDTLKRLFANSNLKD